MFNMLFQVSYTLNKAKAYPPVYDVLKTAPAWCHATTSLWFLQVGSFDSVESWKRRILASMDSDDFLLVMDVTSPVRAGAYAGFLPQSAWDWLRQHAYIT